MKISRDQIHPEMRTLGSIIRRLDSNRRNSTFNVTDKLMKSVKGTWLGTKSNCTFREIEREDGSKLRILVCEAKERQTIKRVPGLLWMHGGGYALGIPESDFLFIDRFMSRRDCVAVMPDYRLSGEAPYPAALDDCYLALKWMKEHAIEYDIRDDQLFVGGDSAGGGLTAAVSIYARDRGEIAIAFQMPLYPMIDDRMQTPSSVDNDAPVWNSESNRNGWQKYLGDMYGTDDVPVYAAPARETDYTGLPPACTFVGGIDPFRDETILFMKKLEEAGVPAHIREFRGCFHGFDVFAAYTKVAKAANLFLAETYEYAVDNYFAAQRKPIR